MKRNHLELERTKRAHQAHLCYAHSAGLLINCVCEFQSGRFRKRKPLGCGRSRCRLCHFEKTFGLPSVSDRREEMRFRDSIEDYEQEESRGSY